MAKKDNYKTVLMMNRVVNLKCDDEVLKCKYVNVEGKGWGTWHINGEDTGMQVSALINHLRDKYLSITVIYKRQY